MYHVIAEKHLRLETKKSGVFCNYVARLGVSMGDTLFVFFI
jgi:hypothetical protein